jgi:type IV pilus assembly protein PilV
MNVSMVFNRVHAFRGRKPQRCRGASLLEVLVAILILSFGMLAMAGLHSVALKYGKMAQFRGVATQLAADLADRMRANPQGALAGDYVFLVAYDPAPGEVNLPPCGIETPCASPAAMAQRDLAEVRRVVQNALPGGWIYVTQDPGPAARMYTVWILWQDPDALGGAADGNTASLAGLCPGEAVAGADPVPQCMPVRVAL